MPIPGFAQRLGKRVLLALFAERRDELGKGFGRIGVDPVPQRRLDEREPRRERRLLGRRQHEGNARSGSRVRVALVVARELLGDERDILEGPREHAHLVEGARELEDAVSRDQSVRRLESEHAAECRRPYDRSVGLAADGERNHARRDRRRRAGRRTAGGVLGRCADCASCRAHRWRIRWSPSCP